LQLQHHNLEDQDLEDKDSEDKEDSEDKDLEDSQDNQLTQPLELNPSSNDQLVKSKVHK
jgi:hypothetical protein